MIGDDDAFANVIVVFAGVGQVAVQVGNHGHCFDDDSFCLIVVIRVERVMFGQDSLVMMMVVVVDGDNTAAAADCR